MNSILKKSARKENRVKVKGACTVHDSRTRKRFPVSVNDLSVGGLSFSLKEAPFAERGIIVIDFEIQGKNTLTLNAVVVKTTSGSNNGMVRYSARFDRKLTVVQFANLLQAFELLPESIAS